MRTQTHKQAPSMEDVWDTIVSGDHEKMKVMLDEQSQAVISMVSARQALARSSRGPHNPACPLPVPPRIAR